MIEHKNHIFTNTTCFQKRIENMRVKIESAETFKHPNWNLNELLKQNDEIKSDQMKNIDTLDMKILAIALHKNSSYSEHPHSGIMNY